MLTNLRWLLSDGSSPVPEPEIVVSSRVRLARNLSGMVFETKMKSGDEKRLLGMMRTILEQELKGTYTELKSITPLERESLLECYLISPKLLKKDHPTAVFVADSGKVSIMVNEEDHLRIQALAGGLSLVECCDTAYQVEGVVGAKVGYAFHEQYGYITSCPTNIGTGLRASVLLHLPALVFSNEIEKVLKGALNLGMAVRGIFGEGTEIKGNLFQVSNQRTLGFKEEELIQSMLKFTYMIVDIEKKTREAIMAKASAEIEDKVYRSMGILESARLISTEEVLNLLSAVRLGIGLGIVKDVSINVVNEIMMVSRPGNLQMYTGELMEEHERDSRRAAYIRARLASCRAGSHTN